MLNGAPAKYKKTDPVAARHCIVPIVVPLSLFLHLLVKMELQPLILHEKAWGRRDGKSGA
jgi:hypothetical protein